MKYVTYEYVDAKTNVPASQEPMRNGPKVPDGIDFYFALISHYPTEAPIFYGITEREDLPDGVEVITKEKFDADYEIEIKARYKKLLEQSLEQVASVRWRIETSGITMYNGAFLKTGEKDQNRISNAYSSLKNGLVEQIDFKGANGWSVMTLTELEPIAQAVVRHVSSYCFGAERDVCDRIEAMDYVTLQEANIEQMFSDAYEERRRADE